jgi:cytochrome c556
MKKFEDAVKDLHQLVDKFEDHYRKGMEETEYYSDALPDVEWFEQFLIFSEMEEGDD